MVRPIFFLSVTLVSLGVSAQRMEVVVHRGANALAPENTIASADSALKYGADWIEVDVRPSRDGVLFNLHDETLDRTTNGHGPIARMTAAAVRRLDAGSWFSPACQGMRVPTIAQMLDHLRGRARVFFDVKRGTPIPWLVALVRAQGYADSSFFWFADERMLHEFVRLAPEMKVKVNANDVARVKYWQARCRPSYVETSPQNITQELLDYCHGQGIRVMAACQEDDVSQFRQVIGSGADLVNLDRPEVFARLLSEAESCAGHVDPLIGSEGEGRVFVGPCMPFGMAKPGPDAVSMPNAGWAPMPEAVKGFSQTHVSGTGGGQKYGNILIQPIRQTDRPAMKELLLSDGRRAPVPVYASRRQHERVALACYDCTYENGIRTEVTAADRCALYRFHGAEGLLVDAASFLGMDTIPDKREAQQYVDSHIELRGDRDICGSTTIRGGWNNGGPYTVYFWLQSDTPLTPELPVGTDPALSADTAVRNGPFYALVRWTAAVANVKVGISYVSTDQARRNIVARSFDEQLAETRRTWAGMLARIPYQGTRKEMRMFYTALYHTLLMPTDKTNENPRWEGGPYFDDYYALWDTYRTSFPLLMDYYPERAAPMVQALLEIYKHDSYLPDARSGDCNGRTQGGSNAEVVLADAYARGLKGIDYDLALEAMVKDAEVPPADDEKEGRGGLAEYNRLGYIPYGTPRAGTRTVEYSYDDWCIALLARGLGREDLHVKYMARSRNWRNLWRADYEWQGMRGFIMPRDAQGRWLDSVPWGRSQLFHPHISYRPDTNAAPWNLPWWNTFFYEALSAEYSLCVPHDVPGLASLCGGDSAFRRRLDTFFDRGHYNVGNEPSFLTPYLYHYIGRPDLSARRVTQIVNRHFSDRADGLPGNDDSGAMSSWLVWAMLGKYPASPQPVPKGGGVPRDADKQPFPVGGGERRGAHYLTIPPVRIQEDAAWNDTSSSPAKSNPKGKDSPEQGLAAATGEVFFTLNRQFRTWPLDARWQGDTLRLTCNGCLYRMPRREVEQGSGFCWDSAYRPGKRYDCRGTFLMVSRRARRTLLRTRKMVYDGITWREQGRTDSLIHLRADVDGTEMWIARRGLLPWVVRMAGNPLGIDWRLNRIPPTPRTPADGLR